MPQKKAELLPLVFLLFFKQKSSEYRRLSKKRELRISLSPGRDSPRGWGRERETGQGAEGTCASFPGDTTWKTSIPQRRLGMAVGYTQANETRSSLTQDPPCPSCAWLWLRPTVPEGRRRQKTKRKKETGQVWKDLLSAYPNVLILHKIQKCDTILGRDGETPGGTEVKISFH